MDGILAKFTSKEKLNPKITVRKPLPLPQNHHCQSLLCCVICTEFCIDNFFCENILILYDFKCYTFAGKTIDHVGIKIEPGFSLKGLINILGFKLRCHVVINFKKEIMIDVSFSPIKIAKGLIAMQKSKKDEENGPKLYAKISAENVDVKLLGYVSLLGISAEVAIDISDDYIKFYTYGNLFNLFAANITVQARYKKIEEADFVVSDAFKNLETAISYLTRRRRDLNPYWLSEHSKIIQTHQNQLMILPLLTP